MLFGKKIFKGLPSLSQFMDLRPQLFKALFTKQCIMSQHGTEVANGSQILKKFYTAVEYRWLWDTATGFRRRNASILLHKQRASSWAGINQSNLFSDKENSGDLYPLNHIEYLLSNTDLSASGPDPQAGLDA